MSGEATVFHTVIVSPEEAMGYEVAGREVSEATVWIRVPETQKEADVLLAEHVGTLLRDHGPPMQDGAAVAEFVDETQEALAGVFDEPEARGVFVRIAVPRDDLAGLRLSRIAVRAAELQAALD